MTRSIGLGLLAAAGLTTPAFALSAQVSEPGGIGLLAAVAVAAIAAYRLRKRK